MKKNGRIIAARVSYLTLLIAFFSLYSLSVYSQKAGFTRLNLITSTFPVQPALSVENNIFFIENPLMINKMSTQATTFFTDSCGSGAQGGEVTNANGNANVSPNSKVNNPSNAVDGDLSTFSELHIDVQQKDVEVIQKISFTGTTYATDIVKLTLSLGTTLFNYKITARAYNNNTPVGTEQDITDLLTLYPATVEFTFNPGVVFNQVRLGVIALQNGNHIASINLHEISLTAPPPPQNGNGGGGGTSSVTACQGNVVLSVNNPTSGLVYNWYNSSNIRVSSSSATTYSPPDLTSGNYVFYVSAARATTCDTESAKHTINLTVNPKPNTPTIALTN